MTAAKVIADSVNAAGDRVTTMEVVMHRFVLAEFNTHRVFSRNSASSRAIPLAKQIQRVMDSPEAKPVVFPAEQKGMQGGEPLTGEDLERAEGVWAAARWDAMTRADDLGLVGVHKSVANRLLEPFMWHTVVVTATAWRNFFRQRCSPLAQPEIRVAADAMLDALAASVPQRLDEGQWHTPYVDETEVPDTEERVRVSAARCARVSYLTQDGRRDPSEDLGLYKRLVQARPTHYSPLEHVCTPRLDNSHRAYAYPELEGVPALKMTLPKYGNLVGWHQLRYDVEAADEYQAYS